MTRSAADVQGPGAPATRAHLEPVRRQQLGEEIIARLRRLITDEGLQPGDRLPSEGDLSKSLGVGRSTIREAVKALCHLGVLESRQGAGTFVGTSAPLEGNDFAEKLARARTFEAHETRFAVEVQNARLAALRRDEDDLAAMRAALQRCYQNAAAGDVEAFIEADMQFHTAVANATKNSVLISLYALLTKWLRPALHTISELGEFESATHVHHEILMGIEASDPDKAAQATETHLRRTAERLTEAVQPPPPSLATPQ